MSLQREWNPDPQSLPFARHIQTHALVSLVQKGLRYHELQSSIDKVCLRDTPVTPKMDPWACNLAIRDLRQRHDPN